MAELKLEQTDTDDLSTFFRTPYNAANLRVVWSRGGMHGIHTVYLWCMAQGWREVATFAAKAGRTPDQRHDHAVRAAKILRLR